MYPLSCGDKGVKLPVTMTPNPQRAAPLPPAENAAGPLELLNVAGDFVEPRFDEDQWREQAAEERGAAMSLATAAEYAMMLTAPGPQQIQAPPARGKLSAREQELVTLVAQGRTDAQIAEQLYISIRTVRSHLDRIRDKTGARRRADLTRLALAEGLV